MKPTSTSYSIPYKDGSGDEIRINYAKHRDGLETLSIEGCGDTINVDLDHLSWLIDALRSVRSTRRIKPYDFNEPSAP